MASRYGHTWISQYGSDPQGPGGKEWRHTLGGLTNDQLRAGFDGDMRRGDAWPPSSTSFRALCFAVPAFSRVRDEITNRGAGQSLSPFAMLVWSRVDMHRWRLADADRADRMLREAFDTAREDVVGGMALPEPRMTLPAPAPPKRTPASPETAAAELSRLNVLLGESVERDLGTQP
jgi:hypothetical protein